jgi:hypothetical protein
MMLLFVQVAAGFTEDQVYFEALAAQISEPFRIRFDKTAA